MKNDTPVESIGTWASHADEDVLRPAPNQEGVELGRNDLAARQLNESVSMKMKNPKGRFLDLTNPVHAYLYGLIQTDGHLSKDTRNKGMRRIPHKKFWTEKQDTFILLHTINESVVALQRSKQSIKMRLWRLRSSNN